MNRIPSNDPGKVRSRRRRTVAIAALFAVWSPCGVRAQDLPRGAIVDDVKCAADAAQSYALYLPSAYSPGRTWSLLIAFHPGARGRAMVEKYAAPAEQYGYIVAGSNTSRNGPWALSGAAVQAMSADLGRRFSIDARRVYLTGLSGGARVAMQVALGKNDIAGVIASSAGYPDSRPRSTVPFAVFGTAGTEDFNYLEMRQLDRKLTSPHHLTVFNGGHSLPPDEVALEAIEWMELQAMKSGRRTRDDVLVERLFDKRQRQLGAAAGPAGMVHLLDALVADFTGLRDVSAEAARARELSAQPDVRKMLARERSDDDTEARLLQEIVELEAGLSDDAGRAAALLRLEDRLKKIAGAANAATDSPERKRARRVLRTITAGAADRVQDREYLALIQQYGSRGRG
jgi:poly(3-hydroxybutyrate) depolymerase